MLNEGREKEFTVIIEVKMHKASSFNNKKAHEALTQAADYRCRLKKSSRNCALLAVVIAWNLREVRSWYGEYSSGILEQREIGNPTDKFFLG